MHRSGVLAALRGLDNVAEGRSVTEPCSLQARARLMRAAPAMIAVVDHPRVAASRRVDVAAHQLPFRRSA
jgi:hypothetical protein